MKDKTKVLSSDEKCLSIIKKIVEQNERIIHYICSPHIYIENTLAEQQIEGLKGIK